MKYPENLGVSIDIQTIYHFTWTFILAVWLKEMYFQDCREKIFFLREELTQNINRFNYLILAKKSKNRISLQIGTFKPIYFENVLMLYPPTLNT